MALGANIDLVVSLYDQIRTAEMNIENMRRDIENTQETIKLEIEDANINGIGPIAAGFIPQASGAYILRKGTRAVRIYWDNDNQRVTSAQVINGNQAPLEVASL